MTDLPDKVVEALGRAVLGVEEDDSLSELEFDRRCIDAMLATGHVQAFTRAALLWMDDQLRGAEWDDNPVDDPRLVLRTALDATAEDDG